VLPKVLGGVFWNYVDAVNHCRPELLAPPANCTLVDGKESLKKRYAWQIFHSKEQLVIWKGVIN
jgi:hypothetical protein